MVCHANYLSLLNPWSSPSHPLRPGASIQEYSRHREIYYDFMTDQAGRREARARDGREGERKEVCYASKRSESEEGEAERRNVDSIHRAQVEMVAHKYSYGIPEARKTSIPAEAHVCPLLLLLLLLPCAFGNSAAGQWKSDGATAGKNAGITIFPPERFFAPGVAAL